MSNLEILKNYSKDKLSGVVEAFEVIPAVYLLKDALGHIIGLYDRRNDKLIKKDFTSYEIKNGILVLRCEEVYDVDTKSLKPFTITSKNYVSLYDPINALFIESPTYYEEKGTYIVDDTEEEFSRTCLTTCEDLILISNNLSHNSKDLYDTTTGKIYKNYFIMNPKNSDIIKLYNPNNRALEAIYNKNEKKLYQCIPTPIVDLYYYEKDGHQEYVHQYRNALAKRYDDYNALFLYYIKGDQMDIYETMFFTDDFVNYKIYSEDIENGKIKKKVRGE